MNRFEQAADKYCDNKKAEKAIKASLKPCQFMGDPIVPGEPEYGSRGYCNERRKSRLESDKRNWCDNCRDNLTALRQLDKIKMARGGLMAAMLYWHEREQDKTTAARELIDQHTEKIQQLEVHRAETVQLIERMETEPPPKMRWQRGDQ